MIKLKKSEFKQLIKEHILREVEEDDVDIDIDIDQAAKEIAQGLEDQMEDKKEKLDEALDPLSIAAYILAGTTLTNIVSKWARKIFVKYKLKKAENIANKIEHISHELEQKFQVPIRKVVGLFTKDVKVRELVTDGVFAMFIIALAGLSGAAALSAIKQLKIIKSGVSVTKLALKGKDLHTIAKEINQDYKDIKNIT